MNGKFDLMKELGNWLSLRFWFN